MKRKERNHTGERPGTSNTSEGPLISLSPEQSGKSFLGLFSTALSREFGMLRFVSRQNEEGGGRDNPYISKEI
ncbi:hypothetical protein [Gracilimonas tropica]|uniref:hypothetical protein n=1 Tax=Gracilimonas tropica TaxID=454600 RepID=UPI00037EC130|nr:hypothetical protein [Gracilimonas tropica]